jgi:hypothetical protein
MKFEKIIRTSMIVMGMGMVLLLAKPAAAQQDVDPTSFEEVGMVKIDQPVTVNTPATQAPQISRVADEASMVPLEARGAHQEDRLALAILILGTLSVVLFALSEAIGSRRRLSRIEKTMDRLRAASKVDWKHSQAA